MTHLVVSSVRACDYDSYASLARVPAQPSSALPVAFIFLVGFFVWFNITLLFFRMLNTTVALCFADLARHSGRTTSHEDR